MGIWSGWWEFSDKERDKQINGSLSSLEFEKVVQGFSDWLHWSLWCLKASKLQCYQGHESHQHQFSSCTEKGDSDCTKKQEGNWIAQHHRWHSVNLSVLLGYRQWKSGMCESYDWRFVDHPSWSKHGHTIAPKWGRMKNSRSWQENRTLENPLCFALETFEIMWCKMPGKSWDVMNSFGMCTTMGPEMHRLTAVLFNFQTWLLATSHSWHPVRGDKYYYGVDELFTRHPEVIQRLCCFGF